MLKKIKMSLTNNVFYIKIAMQIVKLITMFFKIYSDMQKYSLENSFSNLAINLFHLNWLPKGE